MLAFIENNNNKRRRPGRPWIQATLTLYFNGGVLESSDLIYLEVFKPGRDTVQLSERRQS